MEETMKIDGARVRSLREARAWSQEHLATVAGLSARTIQRVEAEGTASLETRMAIAAAFECGPESLLSAPAPVTPATPVTPVEPVVHVASGPASFRRESRARIGVSIAWATAILCAAVARAPEYVTLLILPSLAAASLLAMLPNAPSRCERLRA